MSPETERPFPGKKAGGPGNSLAPGRPTGIGFGLFVGQQPGRFDFGL
jgi:hypothetical protein